MVFGVDASRGLAIGNRAVEIHLSYRETATVDNRGDGVWLYTEVDMAALPWPDQVRTYSFRVPADTVRSDSAAVLGPVFMQVARVVLKPTNIVGLDQNLCYIPRPRFFQRANT